MALSGHLSKILLRATTRPCFTVHPPSATAATPVPPLGRHRVAPAIHSSSSIFPFPSPVPIPCFPGNAIDSSLFKQWLHNLQSEIGILADGTLALRQVLIQVPGIVFARGPAVTVLILLESDGETYAVLTEQARVPTEELFWNCLLECWMMTRVISLALQFVEEETGIKFKLEDMVDLTAFLDSSTGCRFFPSPTVDYKRPTYEKVENLQALLPRECNICQMQIGEMLNFMDSKCSSIHFLH